MTGIYIHIPFCRRKCDYCAFFSRPLANEDLLARYVDALTGEIRRTLDELGNPDIDTLYIGGGTPSLLEPGQVESLIDAVRLNGNLSRESESTLEINPEDVSREYLHSLKEKGINRFILGIQSLDRKTLNFLGRGSFADQAERLEVFFSLDGCRKGVDIISGIPTLSDMLLEDELKKILDFGPDHLSLYSLTLEPETPLADRFSPAEDFDEIQVYQYERACHLIAEGGLARYEVSNFARPGFESRHNRKYWNYEPYAGFGPGSHSLLGGERYSNDMAIHEYILSDRSRVRRDARNRDDILVEIVMTGLRQSEGMILEISAERAGIEVPEELIHRMKTHPALEVKRKSEGTLVRVKEDHLLMTDTLVYQCLEPWISFPGREKVSRVFQGGTV